MGAVHQSTSSMKKDKVLLSCFLLALYLPAGYGWCVVLGSASSSSFVAVVKIVSQHPTSTQA
jgi:hypothetical protein